MNSSLLSSLGPMLAAPWHQRRNTGGVWGLAIVVAVVLAGPAFLYALCAWASFRASAHPARAVLDLQHDTALLSLAGLVLACCLSMLVLSAFALTVYNLLDQNRPVLARLVPRHPGRLRLALVVAWGVSVAIITALFNDRLGHPLAWMAGSGVVLAFVAASIRWPVLWAIAAVEPVALVWPGTHDVLAALQETWLAQPVAIAWSAMAASLVLLVALIQAGGRHHIASDEVRRRRIQRFQMRSRGAEPMVAGQRGAYDRWKTRPYYLLMGRVLERPRKAVFGKVMLGLGPGLHWTCNATMVVTSTLSSLLAYGVIALLGPHVALVHDFGPFVFFGLCAGLGPGMVGAALQAPARLHQTRREQALLMLLPGVPRGAALNRRLAWQLTGQFALSWTGALLIVVALRELAGEPPALLLAHLPAGRFAPLLLIAALPTFAFQWRSWARMGAPAPMANLLPLLVMFGLVALLAWAALHGELVAVAGGAVGLAMAWSALRWWRMGREPSALPVGRLA